MITFAVLGYALMLLVIAVGVLVTKRPFGLLEAALSTVAVTGLVSLVVQTGMTLAVISILGIITFAAIVIMVSVAAICMGLARHDAKVNSHSDFK